MQKIRSVLKEKSYLFLWLLISFLSSFGQSEGVSLENFNSKQGLSNDWINTIAEDHNGFLWVGTRHGLNVFNGGKAHVLNHDAYDSLSLSSDDISSMIFTNSKKIIAGTWGGGINIVDPITKSVTHPKDLKRSELVIKKIIEDGDGKVWLGTYGDGFYRYDLTEDNFTKCVFNGHDLTEFNYCETMHFFNDTVWVSTRSGGLAYISQETFEIIPFKLKNPWSEDYKQITAIHDDGKNLLIGTHYGDFYKVDTKFMKIHSRHDFRKKNNNVRITDINVSNAGVLWVSTTSGFFKSYKDNFIELFSSKTELPYYDNFCSYLDSRGLLWIGTWGKGLNRFGMEEYQFNHIDFSGFQTNNIKALYELNDSTILMGSSSGVLAYDTKKQNVYKPNVTGSYADKVLNGVIVGISKFHENVLVSIEGEGLFVMDNQLVSKEYKHNNTSVFHETMLTDVSHLRNGETWIGTWTKGICMINESNDSLYYFRDQDGVPINQIYTTFIKGSGQVLIGTREGLYSFNDKTFEFKLFDDFHLGNGDKKTMRDIQSIAEDVYGNVWFSASNGIACYSGSEEVLIDLPRSNPDFHNVFFRMIMVDDLLWGTTNSGLIRVNVKTHKTSKYTIDDGLLSNSFFRQGILKTENRVLYLGNGDGVVFFDLDAKENGEIKSKVFLDELYISDEKVVEELFTGHISQVDKLELKHDENNISFQLNVLDFYDENEEVFAHKLVGFDSKWLKHLRSENQIKYTNLPPGTYELAYTTIFEGEVSEEDIKTITIHIQTPFWETWWFRVLTILLVLIILLLISYRRRKKVAFQKQLLELKVEERTRVINEKNKELKEQKEAVNSNLRYASLLQKSLLSKPEQIEKSFSNHFIYYKPQSVVSGDFYWSVKLGEKNIFVSTDCTGHGISGAFLSVLGISTLRSIVEVRRIIRPDLILNELHSVVTQSIKEGGNDLNDGMDLTVICYDNETKILEVSSAKSSPIIVEGTDIIRLRGDRFPIGGDISSYPNRTPYLLKTLKIKERAMLFLFTDGFQDQFGGEYKKKYMQKNFRDFLIGNSDLSTKEQLKLINKEFLSWKGDLPQTDDVQVIGLEIIP